jgi:hypothetical protein
MHAKVPAFARAGVARVKMAFVFDAETDGRELALQRLPNAFDADIGVRAHERRDCDLQLAS